MIIKGEQRGTGAGTRATCSVKITTANNKCCNVQKRHEKTRKKYGAFKLTRGSMVLPLIEGQNSHEPRKNKEKKLSKIALGEMMSSEVISIFTAC